MADFTTNIIALMHSYAERNISEDELQHLNNWLAEDEANKEEFAKYLALLKESEALYKVDKLEIEKAWLKISQNIDKPGRSIKNRGSIIWLPYAAAVVVLLIVGYFMADLFKSDVDFNKDYDFAEVSSVGSKKAVLIMDGGRKMKLEHSTEKVISETDGTIINKDSTNSLIYNKNDEKSSRLIYNKIEVPRGGEYMLILADGTKVWLNSESSLKFPVQFTTNIRRVELIGEAYFEINHNPSKPFIIKTRDTEIEVLGTSFNVSSYDDQNYIATTLVEGSIQLRTLGNTKQLQPGHQAIVKRGDNVFQVKKVNTGVYTSWTKGVFQFKNQSLEEITKQLGRWYNVDFFFTENQFRELRFSGAAKREKPIDFALELIEKMADVQFAIEGDHIIVGR